MGKLTKYLDKISLGINVGFRWLIGVLMLLIVLEVIMRYVFNAPTVWGFDVQAQLKAFVMTIGLGYTLLKRGHVVVDLLTVKMSLRRKKAVSVFGYVIFIFPVLLATTYSWWVWAGRSWGIMERSWSPWGPPVYPLKTLLVICFVLFLLQAISECIKDTISLKRGSEEWIQDR